MKWLNLVCVLLLTVTFCMGCSGASEKPLKEMPAPSGPPQPPPPGVKYIYPEESSTPSASKPAPATAPALPKPTPAEPITPQELPIPAHFSTYTDEAELFSISYPPDWEPALSAIEGIEEYTKELIISIESDLPVEQTSMIFIAGVRTETGGYMPNVNIVVESIPDIAWTHDKVVEEGIRGLKTVVQDYHELSRTKTTVGGREAIIVEYEGTLPPFGKGYFLALNTLVGKTTWQVTCTEWSGKRSEWKEDFNAIVRSLRILK